VFNTRTEPPLSPAHRAISARSLHRLVAIDLRPAPALLPVKREEEEEKEKEGEEGTRGHTHTRAWHPLLDKKGALALFVQCQSSLHRTAVQVKSQTTRTFAEYSTVACTYRSKYYLP